MSQKTWGGRFSGGTDDRVEAFTESVSIDRRLYRHDVRASQAHARMLGQAGLLSPDEHEAGRARIGARTPAVPLQLVQVLHPVAPHASPSLIARRKATNSLMSGAT